MGKRLALGLTRRQCLAMSQSPPTIFAPERRIALRRRARALQKQPNAARYLLDDMVEDVIERLSFLRVEPRNVLVVGDIHGALGRALTAQGAEVTRAAPAPMAGEIALDEQLPWPVRGFDLIASLAALDTVNDLPGALIHARDALKPGGLLIASMMGAGCLPTLRGAMLSADGERPAARMHPMVDVRSGAGLLQRAGLSNPVADSRGLDVRFGSLDGLVADLRAQALTSVLASSAPPIGKAGLARARTAFAAAADFDGRTREHFEILTLSGWRT